LLPSEKEEIGSLVFSNDLKMADKIWNGTPPWQYSGPKLMAPNILYLEVYGAMVLLGRMLKIIIQMIQIT
jgi:hypothetical protein